MTVAVLFTALALAAADPQAPDQPPTAPPPKPAAQDAAVSAVTVNGTKQAQVETSIDRRSYSVANDIQAQTGSIADVLRSIPSVQVDFNGNISLRGDSSVAVLLDGKPSSQFSGDTLAQALSTLPASQIDRIEVMTNPSAEFRADGMGGIINLISKKAKGAGRTGSIRVQGVTGPHATLSGNIGYNSEKLSATADVTYRHDHGTTAIGHQAVLPNPSSGALDASTNMTAQQGLQDTVQAHAGADYDLTASTRLSGSLRYYYGKADIRNAENFRQDGDDGALASAFARLSDARLQQSIGEGSLTLRHKFGEGHDLTLTATYMGLTGSTDRRDEIDPIPPGAPGQTAEVDRASENRHPAFTADYQRPMPHGAKLKLGYDFEYAADRIDHTGGKGVVGGPIAPASDQAGVFIDHDTDHQIYATYEQPVGRLDVLGGLRVETAHLALDQRIPGGQTVQDYTKLFPTLHLSYDLANGRKLTGSYSRRILRPGPADLDPFPYMDAASSITQGDPHLRPRDGDSYELGYEARKETRSFLATLYWRRNHNSLYFVNIELPDGINHGQLTNIGHQTNGGLELVLSDNLTPKVKYSLSADAYWTDISAPFLAPGQTLSGMTGFGRANLEWQVTPKDFLQINAFVNAKRLTPQGYILPTASGNIGYRHTVNSKVSWLLVVQDPFHTLRTRTVSTYPNGASTHDLVTYNSRAVSLTLVWNFGGKPRDPAFDFTPGGTGG